MTVKLYEVLPHRNKILRQCSSCGWEKKILEWKAEIGKGEFLLIIENEGEIKHEKFRKD